MGLMSPVKRKKQLAGSGSLIRCIKTKTGNKGDVAN
jgi:hypothetical protein